MLVFVSGVFKGWKHETFGQCFLDYTWLIQDELPQEPWDTQQGIARNLANNLKWQSVSDAVVKFPSTRIKAGAKREFSGSGNAFIGFPRTSAYVGIGIWGYSVSANGFADFRRVTAKTGVNISAAGNGFAGFSRYKAVISGSGSASANGEAVGAFPTIRGVFSGVETPNAVGVKNPTDEEMLLFVVELLTYKQNSSMVRKI